MRMKSGISNELVFTLRVAVTQKTENVCIGGTISWSFDFCVKASQLLALSGYFLVWLSRLPILNNLESVPIFNARCATDGHRSEGFSNRSHNQLWLSHHQGRCITLVSQIQQLNGILQPHLILGKSVLHQHHPSLPHQPLSLPGRLDIQRQIPNKILEVLACQSTVLNSQRAWRWAIRDTIVEGESIVSCGRHIHFTNDFTQDSQVVHNVSQSFWERP